MRGNKRLVQSVAVAGAAGILVFSVTFSQPQIMQTEETIQSIRYGTAGIMADLGPEGPIDDILPQKVTIEQHAIDKVSASIQVEDFILGGQAAGSDGAASSDSKIPASGDAKENPGYEEFKEQNVQEDTKEQEETDDKDDNKDKDDKKADAKEKKQDSIAKKWENKLMADVDDCLNIRKSKSENSQVVGKLRKGDVANVIKKNKGWTKIKSGSVTGYVKNDYCVYGTKAYKLAKKICKTYATVKADGLRIRKKAHEKAIILEAAFKGDKLLVNTKAKKRDGWVEVKLNSLKGYVAEDFVKVGLGTGEAISIEEEQAQLAAQKKAAQAASGSVAASSSSSVSSSDLTLLSAIIFCEAGGESYAGQVAVGAVVMNRVKSGSYPNTISGVVYQSGQFSPVANGALARALSNGNYQHCVSAARAALAGSDNTGGAKFFHRVNGAAGLVIGNHVFY